MSFSETCFWKSQVLEIVCKPNMPMVFHVEGFLARVVTGKLNA